jgi:putative membrane protein
VGVAEARHLGATCVNVGGIPKKLFVHASHYAEDFEDAAGYGPRPERRLLRRRCLGGPRSRSVRSSGMDRPMSSTRDPAADRPPSPLAPLALLSRTSDRSFYAFNAVLSTLALAFLLYILVLRPGAGGADLRFLPPLNAALNATAASLLVAGLIAIKRRAVVAHKYMMVAAFVASSLFLVCYLAYHFVHGDTKFQGTGPIRTVYFAVLISHIVLSMSIVPLALTSFYFALKARFVAHTKVAKITLPIWLYVSVTGVLIYFMLRGSPPAVP